MSREVVEAMTVLAREKGITPVSANDLRMEGVTDEEADAFMKALNETPMIWCSPRSAASSGGAGTAGTAACTCSRRISSRS